MCLIAYMPANKRLTLEECFTALKANADGYGIMYPDGRGGLNIIKNRRSCQKEFAADYASVPHDVPVAIHWRLATRGEVKNANTHPFLVVSGDETSHGLDVAMMHNGTIDIESPELRSDSWAFANDLVRPLLLRDPDLLYEAAFQDLLLARIGGYGESWGYPNRLLFMDGSGTVVIINESTGWWLRGCWLSNNCSIGAKPRLSLYGGKTKTKSKAANTAKWTEGTYGGGWSWEFGEYEEKPVKHAHKHDNGETLITTGLLMTCNESEIYQLVIDEPDAITDWILKEVGGNNWR